MPPAPKLTRPKFEFELTSNDLALSQKFYTKLFGAEPSRVGPSFIEFDVADPPVVLALRAGAASPGGALNHVGLRLPNSPDLVEVQRRLELGGVSTIRQDNVECCYARQNKFWATDPEAVLWELYTVEEDLDHSGFVDPPVPAAWNGQEHPEAIWTHLLGAPLPQRIPFDDESVAEVRLTGTLNAALTEPQIVSLFAEARRVLVRGGKIVVTALVASAPLPFKPQFPPPASQVEHVPVESEPLAALKAVGFTAFYFETLANVSCLPGAEGIELKHMQLVGRKPAPPNETLKTVVYLGPFAEVVDDLGNIYRCGEPIMMPTEHWKLLGEKFPDRQFAEIEPR